ncbi:phage tail tape measure C-terminal domain-containing protein [Caballeronia sp. DA-9]|uniref:phage tail tape measure C-terminal domain-containing protein n=1 Tax=Caballeronia sp. DA-9 TaxID=3436237 RepID=UPI003F66E3E8
MLRQRAAILGVTEAAEPFIAHMESVADATKAASDAAKAKAAADKAASAEAARSIADTQKFVDAINAEAAAIGKTRAELLQLEAAQRGVTADVSAAISKIQAHADETEKASHNTHDFSLESAGARKELIVLGHELSQGNIKNFAGSILVLAERSNAMGLIFNKTVGIIAGFGAILAITTEVTIKTAEALTQYGNSVNSIARTTGLSTDSIQEFGFAASTVGVNTKDAAAALDGLTKSQNEAIHGNKDAAAAYKAVGISLADLKTLSPEDVLERVEDAFSKTADGAGKAAVAQELFGSGAEALIPLLDQGSAGARELSEAFEASGGALSGDTIRALAEYEEHLKTSQAAMSNVNRTASLALLPTIINLTEAFTTNAGTSPLLTAFYEGLAFVIKSVVAVVATAVSAMLDFSDLVDTVVAVVAHGLRGEWSEAVKAGEDGYKKLMTNGSNYAAFMKKILSDTVPPVSQAAAPTLPPIKFAKGQNGAPKTNQDALNSQIKDLKEQLDAREKLMRDSVDHIKSLQQQGVIDAMTAIQQEHDARAAGYSDELQIADKEIALASHAKSKAALVEWQNKKKAIQAAIAKNDQDEADATALLQAKETAATKAYTDALNTALQVRSDAIASQLQGKTLGATDADDLARASAAAKEYSDKYLALTKSLTENKISPAQYSDEITALQDYEKKRLELESQATAQIKALNADGFAGAQKAAADYAEDASNRFKQVGSAVSDIARGMEDAFVTFVTTGKLSFSSLATSVIADIARMQAKAAISGLFNFAIGAVSSYFTGSTSSTSAGLGLSAGATSAIPAATSSLVGSNSYGFYADGGHVAGPGSGTSDDVAAWLSNGEFVVNAAQTAKHRSLLEAINNGTRINGLAKFATGGYVGPSVPVAAGGGGITIAPNVTVEGGSNAAANQSNGADLNKKIEAVVRAVVVNERKQGGALWKMAQGIK